MDYTSLILVKPGVDEGQWSWHRYVLPSQQLLPVIHHLWQIYLP